MNVLEIKNFKKFLKKKLFKKFNALTIKEKLSIL
jgi:hypothetical protein